MAMLTMPQLIATIRRRSTDRDLSDDLSDVALWAVLQAAGDFEAALKSSHSVERAIQIRRRLTVCREVLTDLESVALARMEAL